MLTYSILYTPDQTTNPGVNYVCSDKKIHVRFRDFNKEQVISGFEKKLTYLMSYLMNFSYITSLFDICDERTIMNALLDSKDVTRIYNCIKYDMQIDFKSFRLTPNYKKSDCVAFGAVEQTAFPLLYDEFGAPKQGDIETFLNKLKVSLLEYLFNDSYSIILHEKSEDNVNEKFVNKELRKEDRVANTDYIQLW